MLATTWLYCCYENQLSEVTSKYESSCLHLESLQQSLADESRQRKLVEQRFFDLAHNHDEMIRLKDEYKGETRKLRQELLTGQREHEDGMRRSLELEDEVEKIERQWQERVRGVERRVTLVEEQRAVAEQRASQLESSMQSSSGEHSEMVRHLQETLQGQRIKKSEIYQSLSSDLLRH